MPGLVSLVGLRRPMRLPASRVPGRAGAGASGASGEARGARLIWAGGRGTAALGPSLTVAVGGSPSTARARRPGFDVLPVPQDMLSWAADCAPARERRPPPRLRPTL